MHHHVDLTRYAGLLLQGVDVAQRGHVLRDELADVRRNMRLGVRGPAERGEREARDQHVSRPVDGEVERRPAGARGPARSPGRAVGDRIAGAAPGDLLPGRAHERPGPRKHRRDVRRRRFALGEAGERRDAGGGRAGQSEDDPDDHGHCEPVHHRDRREQQHEEPRRGGQASACDDRAAAHRCGPRRGARPEPLGARLVEARLKLDRVVHGQPDEHGQRRDRRHRQVVARECDESVRHCRRGEGQPERQQPHTGPEHQRQRGGHEQERRSEQDEDRVLDRRGQGIDHHRDARDDVALVAGHGEARLRRGALEQPDGVLRLRVAQARLQPDLDERSVGAREQRCEAGLGHPHAPGRVEDQLGDELRVVDLRDAREVVLERSRQRLAQELLVGELLGVVCELLLPGLR